MPATVQRATRAATPATVCARGEGRAVATTAAARAARGSRGATNGRRARRRSGRAVRRTAGARSEAARGWVPMRDR